LRHLLDALAASKTTVQGGTRCQNSRFLGN
jgi:hypothetical protein